MSLVFHKCCLCYSAEMKYFQLLVFAGAFISVFCDTLEYNDGCKFEEPIDSCSLEDGSLTLPNLAKKYGYPAETHAIQTEDGYILTVYRIPYGRKCGQGEEKKVPVLLMHGLLSSAYDYMILGPAKSLGYVLADNCYDVWLGNNRGNSESKKHVKWKTYQKEFWDFTWHELGKYDLPAMIDYILSATNQSSLHYIGHSQGTTQFFVFGAIRPEYHHKIRSMQALSPVVYMEHLKSPIVKVLTPFQKPLKKLIDMVGLYEFVPQIEFLNLLGSEICKNDYPYFQGLCCNVLFLLCGFDAPQLNRTILPAIIGHTPAGAAVKQLMHYAQGVVSHKFRQFDHGPIKNLVVYKSLFPPTYDVTKINVPIALYYGKNDWMAAIKDVKVLARKLPNIIDNYEVPYSKFNHLDFIFATDIMHLLYKRLIQSLHAH